MDPKMIHSLEQAVPAMRGIAESVAAYYMALVNSGISRDHALTLTLHFQQQMAQRAQMGDA